MNERIKELVKQAGGHFSTHNLMSNPVQHRESIELWDKNIEKFAELIVKDCIDINQQELSFSAFERLMNKYKDHFGVEE